MGNASITKRALVNVQNAFFNHPEWEAKILTTIHDEILTTHHCKYDDIVVKCVENEMIKAGEYYVKKVPMKVDVQLGKHWIH